MKKVFLLGICGIALAACDSATTSLEQYCLNAAKKEGMDINPAMTEHCKCVQKTMLEQYGQEKTTALATYLSIIEDKGPEAALKAVEKYKTFSVSPLSEAFVNISIECALGSGLVSFE